MTPIERFTKLINFKGFGNPNNKGIFCFVGLEEAGGYEQNDFQNLDTLIEDNYGNEYKTELPHDYYLSKQKWQLDHGKKYTDIYEIMGKIITCYDGANFDDSNFGLRLKNTLDNRLFSENGQCFQMNIYPLGKKNDAEWPNHYSNQEWFGLSSREEYLNQLKEYKRFDSIYNYWEIRNNNFVCTICFDKGHWDDFRNIFKLSPKDNISKDNNFEFYKNERIILTPFFQNTFVDTKKIKTIVATITDNFHQ